MVARQFPKPTDLVDLVKFKRPELDSTKRRLDVDTRHDFDRGREGGGKPGRAQLVSAVLHAKARNLLRAG